MIYKLISLALLSLHITNIISQEFEYAIVPGAQNGWQFVQNLFMTMQGPIHQEVNGDTWPETTEAQLQDYYQKIFSDKTHNLLFLTRQDNSKETLFIGYTIFHTQDQYVWLDSTSFDITAAEDLTANDEGKYMQVGEKLRDMLLDYVQKNYAQVTKIFSVLPTAQSPLCVINQNHLLNLGFNQTTDPEALRDFDQDEKNVLAFEHAAVPVQKSGNLVWNFIKSLF